MRKQYYRMVDEKNGCPHTLFHGVNGSRRIPLDTWTSAIQKPVTDGSGTTVYTSGFHVLTSVKEIRQFAKSRFKYLDHRVIVPVWVDESAGIWKKSHSRANVMLAAKMLITSKQWNRRQKI